MISWTLSKLLIVYFEEEVIIESEFIVQSLDLGTEVGKECLNT